MRGMGLIVAELCILATVGLGETVTTWAMEIEMSGSMSIGERFDDNARFTSTNQTSSYATFVSPQLALKSNQSTVRSSLSYVGSLEYHSPSTELNSISHQVSGSLATDWGPLLTTTLVESLSQTPDSLQSGGSPGLLLPRVTSLSNVASIGAEYRSSRRTKLSLSYSNSMTRYDSASLAGGSSHSVTGSESYELSEKISTNVNYYHTWSLPERESRTETDKASGGFSWNLFPNTSMSGSVGWIWYRGNGSGSSYSAAASLSRSFHRGSISIGYSRDVSGTNGQAQGIALADSISVTSTYQMLENLSGSVGAAYYKYSPALLNGISSRSYSGNASLSLLMTKVMTGRLFYSYFRQDAGGVESSTVRTLTRNQVGADLIFSF